MTTFNFSVLYLELNTQFSSETVFCGTVEAENEAEASAKVQAALGGSPSRISISAVEYVNGINIIEEA